MNQQTIIRLCHAIYTSGIDTGEEENMKLVMVAISAVLLDYGIIWQTTNAKNYFEENVNCKYYEKLGNFEELLLECTEWVFFKVKTNRTVGPY